MKRDEERRWIFLVIVAIALVFVSHFPAKSGLVVRTISGTSTVSGTVSAFTPELGEGYIIIHLWVNEDIISIIVYLWENPPLYLQLLEWPPYIGDPVTFVDVNPTPGALFDYEATPQTRIVRQK